VDARTGGPQALRRVRWPREQTAAGTRRPYPWGVRVVLIGLWLVAPAWSADVPTLKETLGKVQSNAGSKAVEDLIEKLKGATQKPPPTPPAPASPIPASAPGLAEPPAQPSSSGSPAPALKPEQAAKRADSGRAPSVDLEIFFAYKSTVIAPEAASALEPLGRALSDPRLAGDTFLIAGHSDGKGSADYNVDLSQKRAEAVRLYLITKFGIGPERLVATGMGTKHLKNAKDPLAAENRRVQIVNVSQGEGAKALQR
jgi:outer membrane protein OmpA-like peptidoglycan-associated protein